MSQSFLGRTKELAFLEARLNKGRSQIGLPFGSK